MSDTSQNKKFVEDDVAWYCFWLFMAAVMFSSTLAPAVLT